MLNRSEGGRVAKAPERQTPPDKNTLTASPIPDGIQTPSSRFGPYTRDRDLYYGERKAKADFCASDGQ